MVGGGWGAGPVPGIAHYRKSLHIIELSRVIAARPSFSSSKDSIHNWVVHEWWLVQTETLKHARQSAPLHATHGKRARPWGPPPPLCACSLSFYRRDSAQKHGHHQWPCYTTQHAITLMSSSQVSTTVEENTGDASASGCRSE